jgi:hypothetical protein
MPTSNIAIYDGAMDSEAREGLPQGRSHAAVGYSPTVEAGGAESAPWPFSL